MKRSTFFLALLALAAACDSEPTAAETLAGSWRFTFTNMSGAGMDCPEAVMTFSMTGSGASLGGTSKSRSFFSCNLGAGSISVSTDTARISSGTADGSNVSLSTTHGATPFANAPLKVIETSEAGTRSGDTIFGSATWVVERPDQSTITLQGQFLASRIR